jgi:hypothetical protein
LGHAVIFDHWVDEGMSRYVGYEQSGDGGTHHREIQYPTLASSHESFSLPELSIVHVADIWLDPLDGDSSVTWNDLGLRSWAPSCAVACGFASVVTGCLN